MVRTIKRANADDRWKVVSEKDPFSAADLESTPAEFTCSRGTWGEVNPAAQRLERHPVDALPPNPDHDPVPVRLYHKQRDFMAHGTSSTGQWWPCTRRAAASRVGDAPTGRALKRVRFAESRDDDNAEMPEPTSVSAPSNLPAEAASSSSAPTSSAERALSAPAVEVPDHVMSEGASSSPDAAVTLSMKRSSDSSNSKSETKRHHTGHSTRDVVMLLDDSDVSRAVERCREVCRRRETFLADVNDWDCESRDNLRAFGSEVTSVACTSGGVTRELMSNESRLLDFLAAARNINGNLQRKTIAKCVRQHKCGILGRLGIAKSSTQFWCIEPR